MPKTVEATLELGGGQIQWFSTRGFSTVSPKGRSQHDNPHLQMPAVAFLKLLLCVDTLALRFAAEAGLWSSFNRH